jgi:hypothetical protein
MNSNDFVVAVEMGPDVCDAPVRSLYFTESIKRWSVERLNATTYIAEST